MKFLAKIVMPTAEENPSVAAPDFNARMLALVKQVRAERAYFATQEDGRRVDHIVVNVADATELPAIAAPFYAWLGVKVEFLPQMSAADVEVMRPQFDALRREREGK
jgi:hypothetical protein